MKLNFLIIQLLALPMALVAVADQYQYSVPVPSHLSDYATLPLARYRVRERDQQVRVDYSLPRELVGRHLHIRLQGPQAPEGQPLVLNGPLGTMVCQQDSCQVEYKDLRINETQVDAHLNNISVTPVEFNQRKEVARLFGASPIGIIRRISK